MTNADNQSPIIKIPPSSNPQNQFDSVITINQPISTKLNQTNFLTWKAKILPIINGYDLQKYIKTSPNQDNPYQLLLGYSHTINIISGGLLLNHRRALDDAHTSSPPPHELDSWICIQLQTVNKGSSSCTDCKYVFFINEIVSSY